MGDVADMIIDRIFDLDYLDDLEWSKRGYPFEIDRDYYHNSIQDFILEPFVVRETPKAVLFAGRHRFNRQPGEIWIPKSLLRGPKKNPLGCPSRLLVWQGFKPTWKYYE